MTAHYDDPQFSYDKYWRTRQYEHKSELLAISRLLKNRRFRTGSDLGGGFGRTTALLAYYCDHVTLVEPSVRQLKLSRTYLQGYSNITPLRATVQKTTLPDSSLDIVQSIRVLHHLPDPKPMFAEISRILKPGGYLLLEFANSANFKSHANSFITGQPILKAPLERRSLGNIRRRTIPFVNHHPVAINKLLHLFHFTTLKTLSVSNLRSQFLKGLLPIKVLLFLESISQAPLSQIYFGPSIFILAQKKASVDNSASP